MRYFRSIPNITIIFLFCLMPLLNSSSAQTGVVEVGEPLHIYLRRQPVQDMTYLYFHPPDDIYNEKAMDNLSYRKTLLPRGSGNDFERMFFPQDPASNFLQFEPNSTIPLTYSFPISAVKPTDLSDITYKLLVLIDIDYGNDKDYDKQISFEITGEADSERVIKEGIVPMDVSQLKKFEGKDGGRLRVNISRKDFLDTTVTIYCGYQGQNSYIVLPYSKYKYEGETSDNGNELWPWFLAAGGIIIIAGIAFFYLKQKQVEKAPPPVEKRRSVARRRK